MSLQVTLAEKIIVKGKGYQLALNFGAKNKDNQDKVPTLHMLTKLHKRV